MTSLVIFVPTSAPMSHHGLGLLFTDSIRDSQRTFLVKWYLSIWIIKKDRLGSNQARCVVGRCTLHRPVLLYGNVLRSSPLSQRQTQQNACASAFDLLREHCTHGKHSVARVSRDRHNFTCRRNGRGLRQRRRTPNCRENCSASNRLGKGSPIHRLSFFELCVSHDCQARRAQPNRFAPSPSLLTASFTSRAASG